MNRSKPYRGLIFWKDIPTPGCPFDCNSTEGNIMTSTVISVTFIHDCEYLVETKNSLYVLIVTESGLPWI